MKPGFFGLVIGATCAFAVPSYGLAQADQATEAHSRPGATSPSAAALAYLDQAIAIIREHHINSTGADWPALIANARARIAGATRTADTYPAIRGVLEALHQRHSSLMEPRAAVPGWRGGPGSHAGGPVAPEPSWRLIDGRVGLIRLPQLDTVGAGGEDVARAYTAAVRSALDRMDQEPLCGWIVDLRGNGGGNMWPMLRGLDPLLGDPPFGAFVMGQAQVQQWIRANGAIYPAPATVPGSRPAFALAHQAAPLAVLIGPETSSSGEMVAIALIGRPGVRSFGSRSAGFSTANRVHPLPDGAQLVITETTVRDRLGRDYSGPIAPEEQVAPELAERAATQWLASRCHSRRGHRGQGAHIPS